MLKKMVKITKQPKVSKIVIKNDIRHADYKNTLINSQQIFHKMKTIMSDYHQLGGYELNRVSLSSFDDKRYLKNNGIQSYAYGHYKI